MSQRTTNLGKAGENFAANFLTANDYKIIARNLRIHRAEIDIVAEIDNIVVFVEVKTRSSNKYGMPAEAVNIRKQKKIIQSASVFLQNEKFRDKFCRFDVIEVYAGDVNNFEGWQINHITNAFEAE